MERSTTNNAWTCFPPVQRPSKQPIGFYFKSLFCWHSESLNCWTNIFNIFVGCLALFYLRSTNFDAFHVSHDYIQSTGTATSQTTFTHNTVQYKTSFKFTIFYSGFVFVFVNAISLMCHLLCDKGFQYDASLFLLDGFAVFCQISAGFTAIFLVNLELPDVDNVKSNLLTQFSPFVLFAIYYLLMFIALLKSLNRYIQRTTEENAAGTCMHVNIVDSFLPCIMTGLIFYLLIDHKGGVVILLLAAATRLAYALGDLWPSRWRWFTHALSHLTGSLAAFLVNWSSIRHMVVQNAPGLFASKYFILPPDIIIILLTLISISYLFFMFLFSLQLCSKLKGKLDVATKSFSDTKTR